MLIKQDGNLLKRHFTHTYTYALYILHNICTLLDVSKRGVLGSADKDIAFFLHILSFF